MMKLWQKVCLVVALLPACTHDFDSFDVTGQNANSSTGGKGGDAAVGSGGAVGTGGGSSTATAGGSSSGSGGQTGGGAVGLGGSNSLDASTKLDGSGTGGVTNVEAGSFCDTTQKECGSVCESVDSPATGCGGPGCSPCSLPHTSGTKCVSQACAPSGCSGGYDDCDQAPSNGCEQAIRNDPLNCGACGKTCDTTNVASLSCTGQFGAGCSPFCVLGYANCNGSPISDDGCETDVRSNATHCGSCNNDCTTRGFACTNSQCGCNDNNDCRGQGSSSATCQAGGLCNCGGADCRQGETCRQGGCTCNGGKACRTGETCCLNGSGCADLNTSASNCGACGHACPTSFVCNVDAITDGGSGTQGPQCECDQDTDCNAGSAGTCSNGACKCGATVCAKGQRCLGNDQCG